MRTRLSAFALVLLWTGSAIADAEDVPERPVAAVSLDYCADQYLLALADSDQIAGLSPEAASLYSYLGEEAEEFPTLRPTAEEVLLADPDLVVRQWGGGFNAALFLERYSVRVLQIGYISSVEGVEATIREVGEALGNGARADQLIERMHARLASQARLRPLGARPRALYLTAGGFSAAHGTFIDAVLQEAGVENAAARNGETGWRGVNLEALAVDPPDIMIRAFFDLQADKMKNWAYSRHSILGTISKDRPVADVPARFLACPAWFFTDAIELIDRARGLSAPSVGISQR